ESRKEMTKIPGAPSAPAKAAILVRRMSSFESKIQLPLNLQRNGRGIRGTYASLQGCVKAKRARWPAFRSSRKRTELEVVQVNLQERRAVKIRQARDLSYDLCVAIAFDGLAVILVGLPDEDDSVNRYLGGMQSGKRQQRVIDGAQAAARGE